MHSILKKRMKEKQKRKSNAKLNAIEGFINAQQFRLAIQILSM